MNDNWKPGDVAAMNLMNRDIRIFCYKDLDTGDVEWMSVDQGGAYPGPLHPARRLVVIDPEDREQVERLADLFGVFADNLAHHLRAFANPTPPKPTEPLGLGAVVEDAEGYQWVYSGGPQPSEGRVWFSPNLNGTALYSEIAAVRVLSEGVTP